MAVRNGFGFELAQGSLDLCRSQFHRSLLSRVREHHALHILHRKVANAAVRLELRRVCSSVIKRATERLARSVVKVLTYAN
jgi:hypothetical protein